VKRSHENETSYYEKGEESVTIGGERAEREVGTKHQIKKERKGSDEAKDDPVGKQNLFFVRGS